MKTGYDQLMWEAGLLVEAFDAVNGQWSANTACDGCC